MLSLITVFVCFNIWDRTSIELATPGSAVRHTFVARHVTDCANQPRELKAKELSICELSKLIGKMVAAIPGVNYAALYIKPLELEKDNMVHTGKAV